MKKIVIRYIPAGMRMQQTDFKEEIQQAVFDNKRESSKSKTKTKSDINETRISDNTASAPVTICKSKNILPGAVLRIDFELCEDTKNVDSTPARDGEANQVIPSKNKYGDSVTSKLHTHETSNLNTPLSVLSNDSLMNEEHKPGNIKIAHLPSFNTDSKMKEPAAITLKSKIYDRIKKFEQFKSFKNKVRPKYTNENINIVVTNSLEVRKNFQHNAENHCPCLHCDDFVNCETWCSNNIKFNESFVGSTRKGGLPLLKTANAPEKTVKINKIYTNNLLIHGMVIPKPVDELKETYFNECIKKALQIMNCSSAKAVQTYMWPAVQRGLNVFMISPHHSGKTLAYLPGLCTFLLEKCYRYSELLNYEGPLVIILCSSIKKCEELQSLINNLLKKSWNDNATVKISFGNSPKENCDILVTVPSVLEENLKSELVRLKRLCHIVIEDADLILKNNRKSMAKFFTIINKMQINRPHYKCIQVIVTSEKWTVDLEQLMKQLYTSPMIVFEDFLEAAIYSKISFGKKKLNPAQRRFYLEDILKRQYAVHKTVIFCHRYEVSEVHEYLQAQGIDCILISNNLTEGEIFENENMWSSQKEGCYKVLICTDALFEKAKIVNATWLIHYSVPSDWIKFRKRFRCLSANLNCPLDNKDDTHQFEDATFLLEATDEICSKIFTNLFNVLTRSYVMHFQLK